MKIIIQTLTIEGKYVLVASPSDTVLDLKKRCKELTGLPTQTIILYYRGCTLQSNMTLEELKIKDG